MVNGTGKVLLVDDEQIVIGVGRQMLEKLGYSVITAASGQEALEIYPAHKDDIQLIILDIVMPGLSAVDIYERLKAINPQVKVLLSSGYGADQQTTEILDRGCDGFIQKPFNMQVLSAKIGEILGGTQ
jgi:CheY-like chemotaxis protein